MILTLGNTISMKTASARQERPAAGTSPQNVGTILKWAGGKTQLLEQIRANLPQELTHNKIHTYIEPFIGGGAVFFDIASRYSFRQAYLFDVNAELITLYNSIKSDVDTLVSVLSKLQKNYLAKNEEARKVFFYKVRDKYNADLSARDFVNPERAALTIFLNRTCFNGLFRVNSKGEFNVPFGSYKNPTILFEDKLRTASALLQNATIELTDFSKTENYADKKTFVYYDPPYRPISQTSSFTAYSKDTFDDNEQRRLFRLYDKLNKKGALQLLSNSDTTNFKKSDRFFDDLYSDYTITRVDARRMINSNPDKRGSIKELLIKNYQ